MRALFETLLILLILSTLVFLFTGCISSKIPRVQSQPPPVINTQNTQVDQMIEPITGDLVPNQQQVTVTSVNEVFTYFILVVITLCVLCVLPNIINYFRANRRSKNQSDHHDDRIVLND